MPNMQGGSVTLSSGVSNNTRGIGDVQAQIDALKAKGVTNIKLLGVGDRQDFQAARLNQQLAAIAAQNGIEFGGALSNLSADRVHPASYQ